MRSPFIHGRLALADAAELIDVYGDDAGFEAAVRADRLVGHGAQASFWPEARLMAARIRV